MVAHYSAGAAAERGAGARDLVRAEANCEDPGRR